MMDRHKTQNKGGGERGFALVLVLWVIVALGVEIALLNGGVGDMVRLATNEGTIIRGEALARSAVEVAAARLLSADDRERWTADGGRREAAFPDAKVFVRISDENGRVNLNLADGPMLAGLLKVVTGSPREAEVLVGRLLAWRLGKNERGGAGGTPGDLGARAPQAGARLPMLADAADFAKVTGAAPEVVVALLPHVTVFTSEARINPTFASETVLRALPNLPPRSIEQIVQMRTGGRSEGLEMAALLKEAQAYISNKRGPAYRIEVSMDQKTRGAIGHAVAVIQLSLDAEAPFRVLSWQFEPANLAEASDTQRSRAQGGSAAKASKQ
jgi:general secretion pathway protein K